MGPGESSQRFSAHCLLEDPGKEQDNSQHLGPCCFAQRCQLLLGPAYSLIPSSEINLVLEIQPDSAWQIMLPKCISSSHLSAT